MTWDEYNYFQNELRKLLFIRNEYKDYEKLLYVVYIILNFLINMKN